MPKPHATKPTLRSLSRRQWLRIAAVAATIGLVVTAGIGARSFYVGEHQAETMTAYSATDSNAQGVSRGDDRERLDDASAATSYVTVTINGSSTVVFGEHFTDVKSVLDAGDIALEPDDSVEPALNTAVDESTIITIERANATVETSEEPIAFNTVTKETSSLAEGVQQVETEGKEGVLETTSLVTRSGGKLVSSNVFTSYVKTAPVDKVILVGTSKTSVDSATSDGSATSIGTTVPVGEMQQWAHDYLLSNGYTEADFTATVFIISHESGWSVTAKNPSSGAYGLPQALPGGKMVSAGADWATNYQTQLKWFWGYCNGRYGGIQGAYSYWLANKSY